MLRVILIAAALSAPGACAAQVDLADSQHTMQSGLDPASFAAGQAVLEARLALKPITGKAKNVVLFIGDGMGISTLTAGRIHAGQKLGKPGEGHVLAMETLPHSALIKTYNTNLQVPDSAGTASAMLTGTKTKAGVINIAPHVPTGVCADALKAPLPSLAQQAAKAGLATGVVTTARLTHATPAVMYAHASDRDWEGPGDVPAAMRSEGCTSIAEQLIYGDHGLDIAMGGGARAFESINVEGDWRGEIVSTSLEMQQAGKGTPLLGLFSSSHMPYTRNRTAQTTAPTLAQMTRTAIARLNGNKAGYFLMVEAGRIDHGHHAGKAELALDDTVAFDAAVAAALDLVDLNETLVLVTADHSHVFTMAGYPARGNPILGVVKSVDDTGAPRSEAYLAPDGKPYTTLGYHNGPGANEGVRDPRTRPGEVLHQVAAIEAYSETHGGEDVALLAGGPSAYLIGGVMEQHVIYHIMHHALQLETAP